MNASLARVLSEMKGSQFVEAHAVAEAEKLMESLSVGLSRVAQLARHAAESQMKVEISVGTAKGTTAQQLDRRRPSITGKTAVDELETPVEGCVNSAQSRVKAVCGHRNSEQRADEGSAMFTVTSAQSENSGSNAWSHSSTNLGL